MQLEVNKPFTAQMLVGSVELTAVPVEVEVKAFGSFGVRVTFLEGAEHGFEPGTQRIIGWNAFPDYEPSISPRPSLDEGE